MNVGAPLTAPVLESVLVSMAPKVLAPRDVQFLGSVWDDAAKTLTLRLRGKGKTSVGLAHSGEPVSVSPPLQAQRADGGVFYDVELNGETEIVLGY